MTSARPRPPLIPGETRAYPVLPLRDIVVFPHMIAAVFVGRKKSILALEEVMRSDTFILLATQKNAPEDDPAMEAIYEIGTLASVLQLLKLPDGTVKVLVEGAQRAKVVKYTDRSEYYEAEAVVLADTMGERVEAKAFARSVATEFESYVKLNKRVPPEVVGVVQQIEDYAKLADTVASHLALKIPDRQAILETTAVTERLEKVLGLIDSEISVLQVEKRIRSRVKRHGEDPARVFSPRADEGDPERDRRCGRQGRCGRDRRQDQENQALEGGAREGDARAQKAPADVADVSGSHCGAQLP
jgi:ATP-dependent Lon protease